MQGFLKMWGRATGLLTLWERTANPSIVIPFFYAVGFVIFLACYTFMLCCIRDVFSATELC